MSGARMTARRLENWTQMQTGKTHIIRFLIVGFLAFLLDASILTVLVKIGVAPGLSRLPSVFAAIVFTWAMNRRFTFATKTAPTWAEFGKYVLAMGLGIAVNFGVYWLVLWLSESARAMPVVAAAIATMTAMTLNFFSARFLLHR